MAVSETHNRFTESGYDSGFWQARHSIAKGIILVFSIVFLAFRGAWGAVAGFVGGICKGWSNDVKPLFSQSGQA